MNDDYLWDGSGEPDPDVEQLEKLLGGYRYQARPLDARFEQSLSTRRPFFWAKYAAAAAVILMALAGAWLLWPRDLPAGDLHAIAEAPELVPLPGEGVVEIPGAGEPSNIIQPVAPTGRRNAALPRAKKHAAQPERDVTNPTPAHAAAPMASELAVASPITNPFVDAETAKHIERAQLLLRSFRNTEGDAEFDVAYERQSSERLLAKNVLLRRDAEAKGNLPMQGLLGSLEPFLLDIANLPDAPSSDEVRAIKARMEKKEIITALQVYSAPILSRSF